MDIKLESLETLSDILEENNIISLTHDESGESTLYFPEELLNDVLDEVNRRCMLLPLDSNGTPIKADSLIRDSMGNIRFIIGVGRDTVLFFRTKTRISYEFSKDVTSQLTVKELLLEMIAKHDGENADELADAYSKMMKLVEGNAVPEEE